MEEMEERSGRVMVCDAGSQCWQERIVKPLSTQHCTVVVRKIIVAATLRAERRPVNEDTVGTDDVIVLEAVRERREELQVTAVVVMEELCDPDDQGLGRAIQLMEDEKSWSARVQNTISRQETNTTHLGNIQLPEPRHSTLYQSLLPSVSVVVAVSSA